MRGRTGRSEKGEKAYVNRFRVSGPPIGQWAKGPVYRNVRARHMRHPRRRRVTRRALRGDSGGAGVVAGKIFDGGLEKKSKYTLCTPSWGVGGWGWVGVVVGLGVGLAMAPRRVDDVNMYVETRKLLDSPRINLRRPMHNY